MQVLGNVATAAERESSYISGRWRQSALPRNKTAHAATAATNGTNDATSYEPFDQLEWRRWVRSTNWASKAALTVSVHHQHWLKCSCHGEVAKECRRDPIEFDSYRNGRPKRTEKISVHQQNTKVSI